jgi:hypothetical protein
MLLAGRRVDLLEAEDLQRANQPPLSRSIFFGSTSKAAPGSVADPGRPHQPA